MKLGKEEILKMLVIVYFENCCGPVCFLDLCRLGYSKQFCQLFCVGVTRDLSER